MGCCNESEKNKCCELKDFYGLEKHLKNFSEISSQYEELWCYWILRKKELSGKLATSQTTNPTMTPHDVSHSEQIIKQIELLLGQERIKKLSATDTWLILDCAYSHDIGMIITIEDLVNDIKSESADSFTEYINKLRTEGNSRKKWQYAEFLLPFFRNWIELDDELFNVSSIYMEQFKNFYDNRDELWPIKFKLALGEFAQDYYRSKHARRTNEKIILEIETDKKPSIVPRRLRYLVGIISQAHGEDIKYLLKNLKDVTSGIGSDYAHPQFVAELLRIGDLLDLDSDRVNVYNFAVSGTLNSATWIHQIKHISTTQLLVSPQKVYVVAEFSISKAKKYLLSLPISDDFSPQPKDELMTDKTLKNLCDASAKELYRWLQMLKEEIEFFSIHWQSIVPKGFCGAAPIFAEPEIYFEGNKVNIEDVGLVYTIETKRAAELIEGIGLYGSPNTFIREIIQNAKDYSKIKFFRDISNKTAFMSPKARKQFKNIKESSFYDIESIARELLQNYRIEITVIKLKKNKRSDDNNSKEYMQIEIRDYGDGITEKRLQAMKRIGNSYKPVIAKVEQKMPKWLKTTGVFGIGLQAVFRIAASFEITSVSHSEYQNDRLIGRKMTFYSSRLGGEIFQEFLDEKERKDFGYGTNVKIVLTKQQAKDYLYLQMNNKNSENEPFDNFFDISKRISENIQEYISEICLYDGFPILFQYFDNIEDRKAKDDNELEDSRDISKLHNDIFGEYLFTYPLKIEKIKKEKPETPNTAFSFWDAESEILIRYDKNKDKNVKEGDSSIELYFKSIIVSDDIDTLEFMKMPMLNCTINIMGLNVSKYLSISREKFTSENKADLIKRVRLAHLSFLQTLSDLFCKNTTDSFSDVKDFFIENYALELWAIFSQIYRKTLFYVNHWILTRLNDNYKKEKLEKMRNDISQKAVDVLFVDMIKEIPDSDCTDSNKDNVIIIVSPDVIFYDYFLEAAENSYWLTDTVNVYNLYYEMFDKESFIAIADRFRHFEGLKIKDVRIAIQSKRPEEYPVKMFYQVFDVGEKLDYCVNIPTEIYWKYVLAIYEYHKFNKNDIHIIFIATKDFEELAVKTVDENSLDEMSRKFAGYLIAPLTVKEFSELLEEKEEAIDIKISKSFGDSKHKSNEIIDFIIKNSVIENTFAESKKRKNIEEKYKVWLKEFFCFCHKRK